MRNDIVVIAFSERVFGMAAATGQRVWEQPGLDWGRGTFRLVVEDGRVCGLSPTGHLFCLDYATGAALWQTPAGAPGSMATLLVKGGFVFVGSAGEFQAFALADGRHLWKDDFKGKGTGDVTIAIPGASAQVDLHG